ncbi:MAG: hypothetical protein WC876_03925 [Candidatus Thermoplasmatota archaeon]|jgi:hypothetical protein
MRWLPWTLGIVGVLQFAVMALVGTNADYVSLDTAYLVMWLAIIGGVLTCYLSCMGGGCGYGGYGGCDCCDDNCECGDCGDCCEPDEKGHEGHGHDGGHQH